MYLAQLNIAKLLAPIDSPQLKDFVDNLDPINAIAEESAGFIWRLKDESGNATSIEGFDDPAIIANMSVWTSVETLKQFMFKTHHINFLKRKSEWFENPSKANYVLWWIPKNHIPTLEEARSKLFYMQEKGESSKAFTFKTSAKYDSPK